MAVEQFGDLGHGHFTDQNSTKIEIFNNSLSHQTNRVVHRFLSPQNGDDAVVVEMKIPAFIFMFIPQKG